MPGARSKILISSLLIFPLWFSLAGPSHPLQQPQGSDSLKILHADMTRFDSRISPDARRLIGNVIFNHDSTTMYCDSAWYYDKQKRVEAYGNIQIRRDYGPEELFGDFLLYDGNSRLAQIWGNVKGTNGEAIMYTDFLFYNLAEEVIYYNDGATLTQDSVTLVSRQGRYFTRDRFAWFGRAVQVEDPDYTFSGDTLTYDLHTSTIEFFGPSRITTKTEKDTLLAEAGWFNTRDSIAHFYQNVQIFNASGHIKTDTLQYDRKSDSGFSRGQTVFTDTTHRIIAEGKYADFSRTPEYVMLTQNARIKYWEDQDTLYLHADTLKSFKKLIPGKIIPAVDSIGTKTDSTFREILAYRKMKFFRSDLSGAADSLYFSTLDSTVRMFRHSFLWSGANQAFADSMKIFTSGKKPRIMEMYSRPMLVSQEDSLLFNQIKGLRIHIFFDDSTRISKVEVQGKAESIYYPKDGEELIGGNKTQSENLTIHMVDNQAETIRFFPASEGILTPIEKINPSRYNFQDFLWNEKQRPRQPEDIFIWEETLPGGSFPLPPSQRP